MLNEQQRKAAFERTGHTIVSAAPGSGKTKTLVARAQSRLENLPPQRMLGLITYTNAATDEIQARINPEGSSMFIGTIHRFCLEYILRPFGWIYGWALPKIISYDEIAGFIEEKKDLDLGENPFDEINKIKRNLKGEIDLSVDWEHSVDIASLARDYFEFLEKKGAIDFNEILFRSFKLVSENFFISKSLANKFFEILVDEFQDTNAFQFHIFLQMKNAGPVTFFLVGDERQQIYRFAGAIPGSFQLAQREFSASHDTLTITYRSTNNIINAYSALFDGHPEISNESENKDINCPVMFLETKKDNYDATIGYYVDELIKANFQESDIAILSTSWYDTLHVSSILRSKYNLVGLGALPHPTKNIKNSTFELLRGLSAFKGKSSVKNLRAIRRCIELHSLENSLNIQENEIPLLLNELILGFSLIAPEDVLTTGLISAKALFNRIFHCEHSTIDEIISLIKPQEIEFWTTHKYFSALSGQSGITCNTIHQAKGLEYEAVVLINMNENKIPHQKCISRNPYIYEPLNEQSREDGRNLFYVAISRAKKVLIIIHNWKPSIFISKLKSKNK